MSELKDYSILDIEAIDDERYKAESAPGKWVPESRVYLKADADKVIDFWKNESHNHYERWFNLNKQYEGWFSKVMRCELAERELRATHRALWLARAERAKERKLHFETLDYFGISFVTINFEESARAWMTCKIEEPSEWVKIFEKVEQLCRAKAEQFKEEK